MVTHATPEIGKRIFPNQILDDVPKDLGLVITVPCYREETIIPLLQSLAQCEAPAKPVEVILVILTSDQDSEEVVSENQRIYWEAEDWYDGQGELPFILHTLHFQGIPHELMGVDLARKLGLDEGADRLNRARQPQGILANLDADARVEPHYLRVLIDFYFRKNPAAIASLGTVNFVADSTASDRQKQVLNWISLRRHYYEVASLDSGYPLAGLTHANVLSCRAWAYSQGQGVQLNGGKGLEPLWHHLVASGPIGRLGEIEVSVLAKFTERHLGGMGKELQSFLARGQSICKALSPSVFQSLRLVIQFGENLNSLRTVGDFQRALARLPFEVRAYLIHSRIHLHWQDVRQNETPWIKWFTRGRWTEALQFWTQEKNGLIPVEEAVGEWLYEYTGWEEESLAVPYLLKRLHEVAEMKSGNYLLRKAS